MAGTRYLIQSSFLAQFIVLILLAVYVGLYRPQDPLCHHLPMFQRGRRRIRATLSRIQQHDQGESLLPPLRVATSQELATQWKAVLQRQGINAAIVRQKPSTLDGVCLDPKSSSNNGQLDIALWLCPAVDHVKNVADSNSKIGRIVTFHGVTFLYPYTSADLDAVAEQAFQWDVTYDVPVEITINSTSETKNETASEETVDAEKMPEFYQMVAPGPVQWIPRRRRSLQVTLMVERRSDWSDWSKALTEWVQEQESALLEWPCLHFPIATNVVLSTYQKKKRRSKSADKKADAVKSNETDGSDSSKTTSNNTLELATEEDIDDAQIFTTSEIEDSIFNRLGSKDSLTLILYVPKVTPTWVADEDGKRSHVFYKDHNLVATIAESLPSGDDINYKPFVANAMAPAHPFLFHQCMGAPHFDPIFHVDSDGSYPKWNFDLWLRRTLNDLYHRARQETIDEGQWLLMSSRSLKVSDEAGAAWEQLEELLTKARQSIPRNEENDSGWDWHGAFLYLEQALQLLFQLRTDRNLMQPLDFSLPQYLAILAPLCMPLFLPHLVGTFRERKRYRMLLEKKKEKAA